MDFNAIQSILQLLTTKCSHQRTRHIPLKRNTTAIHSGDCELCRVMIYPHTSARYQMRTPAVEKKRRAIKKKEKIQKAVRDSTQGSAVDADARAVGDIADERAIKPISPPPTPPPLLESPLPMRLPVKQETPKTMFLHRFLNFLFLINVWSLPNYRSKYQCSLRKCRQTCRCRQTSRDPSHQIRLGSQLGRF